MVRVLIYSGIFFIMLFCLLANPAPVSIEIEDIILILFPFSLGILSLATVQSFKIDVYENNLLIAIFLYLSYLLASILLGLIHDVPLLNILRSIGPYIDFFPLLFLGFLPKHLLNPWVVGTILISIGILQASYQIYLFLMHANQMTNTAGILRSRITLIEPRTTLPIVLSTAILPLVYFAYYGFSKRILAAGLVLFSLFAGAATLTRSIILSIIIGWLTFGFLYLYQQYHMRSLFLSRLFTRFVIYALVFVIIFSLISSIPKVYMLEQGVLARFYSSQASAATDYSNGRLYDEWIPAINTWLHADILSLFFGIGAGNTFIVASGEERTYIHNLSIYTLVYGGMYGFFVCLWLYFTIFKTFVIRALQSQQMIYLGFAALLASLYFYGQLFAVHKGLAFNAMLFLLMTLALKLDI